MKDKIIITFIFLISMIGMSIATPIYKNCGNTFGDSQCSDAACRTDFDPSIPIINAEMDFATPQQNGSTTECTWSNWKQITAILSSDGNHINFTPKSPLKSLSGLHTYTICTTKIRQER